jgi:hypothetical protein
MATLFVNFSEAAPARYPGPDKTLADFRGFRPGGGVTVATLVAMAREDSAAAGKSDPVKALVAGRVGCHKDQVEVSNGDNGSLKVITPAGAGHIDLKDLALILPSRNEMLAAPPGHAGGIELPNGRLSTINN